MRQPDALGGCIICNIMPTAQGKHSEVLCKAMYLHAASTIQAKQCNKQSSKAIACKVILLLVHNASRDQAKVEIKSDLFMIVYSTCPVDLSA